MESYVLLLDIYGDLLSNGQREALEMKYNEDLSLAEIAAEIGGVSRQSVHYSIKNGERRLLELESCLGFAARLRIMSEKLGEAKALLTELSAQHGAGDKRFARLGKLLEQIEKEL